MSRSRYCTITKADEGRRSELREPTFYMAGTKGADVFLIIWRAQPRHYSDDVSSREMFFYGNKPNGFNDPPGQSYFLVTTRIVISVRTNSVYFRSTGEMKLCPRPSTPPPPASRKPAPDTRNTTYHLLRYFLLLIPSILYLSLSRVITIILVFVGPPHTHSIPTPL